MKMSKRPLFIDVSSHQTYLELEKAYLAGNDVKGIIMRASVGLNKDVDFNVFDDYYNWDEIYRGSYHAIWPIYSVPIQVNTWMEVDPNGTLHMLDAELHNDLEPEVVANAIVLESNLVLERTGKRPWMYGAYYFLMKYLIPFVSEEWLNEHWWVLAAYGDGDGDEDDGYSMMLPDKIDIDKVAFQQTTSKAELYPGSGNVDRDRFLLGGEEELIDFMDEYFDIDEDLPVSDCDDQIADAVAVVATEYENKIAELEEIHEADLYELKKTHALVLKASTKKAHNDALNSLIAPLLK